MSTDRTTSRTGPLAGLRVVELGGIGPGPFAGMLLADQGADVIRIDRPAEAGRASAHPILHRGRRSVTLDLKDPASVEAVLRIIDTADALIEGFRPGVTERLGLGPEACLARNPRLVYGRMTGWGQDGPLAQAPGHDINYIAVAGALGAMGAGDENPPVPLNLVGDMGGGGMLLALGITTALVHAQRTGEGQVVDAAMTDGTAVQLALIHGLLATGRWTDERGVNLFDGGAPFYRTYRTSDGGFMAVGSVESQFYAVLLGVLGLTDEALFAKQHDRDAWPAMARRLAEVFASRTRAEWTAAFDGTESCVTPVHGLTEAATDPHNLARGTYYTEGDVLQPAPAPRYQGTPAATPQPAPLTGAHTREVLVEIGLDADVVDALAPQL
ncbi:CaiB/BaiF CoA transferase family protein [Streptacidiphilus jiangxiensis]|uniref:Alpha-methylacyl-CoA racemase n=1 Tax=Streptacidiphilus jiangxiensis TaxID=235985 RepID=A0A1H7T4S1_STRJI|nr:CaiB/BaiF CoA-transferase family protein [Streptacidiphilus jiangxiensis]SEL79499.1 alpha-methylacyl-CoA racemase [Streptacidiphilus jiangxiensis]